MKESIFAKAKKARENKKGFTLVELIVVLVILAILAAILVPALLGWIDKAKEKQILVNARTAYMAAQTLVSEDYAKKTSAQEYGDGLYTTTAPILTAIKTLAQVDGNVTSVNITAHKVDGLAYVEGDYTATLSGGNWTITKN